MIRAGQAAGLAQRAMVPRLAERGSARSGARRIAITSGKGGVGKSHVAANLAYRLAARGARVLLVDADLGLASLDLLFGVRTVRTTLDVLRGDVAPRDACIAVAPGLALLAAAPGRYEMANLDAVARARVAAAIDALAIEHDAVVIDTSAGIGAISVELASGADDVVVVATPDATAIRDAYATIKVLASRGSVPRTWWLVCNQVDGAEQAASIAGHVRALARGFLQIDVRVLGHVPRDSAVGAALAAGTALVAHAPHAPAALALCRLADRLQHGAEVGVTC